MVSRKLLKKQYRQWTRQEVPDRRTVKLSMRAIVSGQTRPIQSVIDELRSKQLTDGR